MLDNQHPDTNMCYAYGVVPVATLTWGDGASTFTAQTLTGLLDELRRRDTWQLSGGPTRDTGEVGEARLIAAVEDHEATQERRAKAQLQDGFRAMAREAWRSLQARAGWRNKRASDYHGVARSTGEQRLCSLSVRSMSNTSDTSVLLDCAQQGESRSITKGR